VEFAGENEDINFAVDAEGAVELLKSLPEKDRDTLVMRYVDDLSVKDIAEFMNESPNVISVRIHRALNRLRKKYQ
jgi:RNA polymerase sigma factor (sigma-70 family)